MCVCVSPHVTGVLTWGGGSGSGAVWPGRERCWGGRRGAAAGRKGLVAGGGRAAILLRGGSSPWATRFSANWPSARPPARRSPSPDPAPRAAGGPSGSVPGDSGVRRRGGQDTPPPPKKNPPHDDEDDVPPPDPHGRRYLAGQQAGADLFGVGVEHATLPVQVALFACGRRKGLGCRGGGPGGAPELGLGRWGGPSALLPPHPATPPTFCPG